MTIEEMTALLKQMGLNKPYIPEWENETDTIVLRTKRAPALVDGRLVGSAVALTPGYRAEGIFLVWTPQKKKAMEAARQHSIKCRCFDSEAELHVPAALADKVLPEFGAKLRKQVSQATIDRLRKQAEVMNANRLRKKD